MPFRFGEFVLDPDARELHRGRRAVHLSPKAFQLLALLVEARPRALSKTELHDRLWPDAFVVEANLANLVGEVRAALGDDRRQPRFVRTVHRFGYAFLDGRRPPAPKASASLAWSGGRAPVPEGEHVLGRDHDLELCFDAPTVSRRHAALTLGGDRATVEDLGSKNGTFVNGRRLDGPAVLADGDELRLGSVRLTFRRRDPAASTRTAAE